MKINQMIYYDKYEMSSNEKVFYILIAGITIFVVGYIFYRSIYISAVLTPLSLFYPRIKIKEIVVNRKRRLVVQFKEALYSISTSLSAGMSIETALKFALKDLEIIYHDPDTHIIKEIGYVVKKIEMNETVEGAFSEFAARSNLEDVISFADVLHTCKRHSTRTHIHTKNRWESCRGD